MVKIIYKMDVSPDIEKKFLDTVKELVIKSNEEAGCISYTLNKSTNIENIYTMIELWKDEAAIKEHNESVHFTTIFPKFKEMGVKEVGLELYEECQF